MNFTPPNPRRNARPQVLGWTLCFLLAATMPAISRADLADVVSFDGNVCRITLTDTIGFEAPTNAYSPDDESGGFRLSGDVVLVSPIGNIPLVDADLAFEPNDELQTIPFELYGTAVAPFPALPLFEDAEFSFEPKAAIGIASRATIRRLLEGEGRSLPLAEVYDENDDGELELLEPAYLFFHIESGLELDLPLAKFLGLNQEDGATDPFQFSVPGDKAITFILDPANPYFYFTPDGQKASDEDANSDSDDGDSNEDADDDGENSEEDESDTLDPDEAYDRAELERLRLEIAFNLQTMLDHDALDNREQFEDMWYVPLLEAGELHALASDLVIHSDPEVADPVALDRLEILTEDARKLYFHQGKLNKLKVIAGQDPAEDTDTDTDNDNDNDNDNESGTDRPGNEPPEEDSNYKLDPVTVGTRLEERIGEVEDLDRAIRDFAEGERKFDDSNDTTDRDTDQNDDDRNRDSDSESDSNSPFPEIEEIAFSWLGGIPFQPETTWGLPDDVGSFYGNVSLASTIPLSPVVELNGTVVMYAGEDGVEMGGNGELSVAIELVPNFLEFGFPLGNASAGVRILDSEQTSYFSGVAQPDISFLPTWIPFRPAGEVKVAGYVSSLHPEDSRITAAGEFGYDMEGLSNLIGVPLDDIVLAEVEMTIDQQGVFARGRSSMSIHPSLATGSALEVEALVSVQKPESSYVHMSGEIELAGVGLNPAVVEVGGEGLLVSGDFVTPLSRIRLEGAVTDQGPRVSGTGSIVIPLGDITAAVGDAHDQVVAAQVELDRIDDAIDAARATVQAERDRDAQRIAAAQSAVSSAQKTVNSIQSSINAQKKSISSWKSQIRSKYKWYKRQPWYKKTTAYASYAAYKISRNARIAVAYGKIAGLETAKATANAALAVAKASLTAVQSAIDTLPIDADPRVAGLYAGREIAAAALIVAEETLGAIPQVDADVSAKIRVTLDKDGLRGTVEATVNGKTISDGRVVLGEKPVVCINIAGVGEICAPF